jgi:hypothetical protein
LEAVELLCLEKADKLQNISISRNPETKRIYSIENYLRSSSKVFKVYSIAADESALVEVTGQPTMSLCSCN